MKVLTISVASYNCESTLKKCLDSMVNAKCVDELEIIVVNDGSNDGTLEIAYRYAAAYPQSVIVVDKPNGGHGSTINASVVRATGRYFKIVDSDDWVETKNLDILVDFLKDCDTDLVMNPYYNVNYHNHEKEIELDYKNVVTCGKIIPVNDIPLSTVDFFHMHSMTFRTELVKKMGPVIDEHCFYVDTQYNAYLFYLTESVLFLDYPIYDYLLGNATQSVSTENMVKRRSQHEKAVTGIFNRLDSIEKDNSNKSRVLMEYISLLCGTQMKILFLLPVKEGKKEFVEFTNRMPCYVAKNLGPKMKAIVNLLTVCNCILYTPVVKILQITNIANKSLN